MRPLRGVAHQADDRGDVDDAAAALLDHGSQDGLGAEEDAGQVGGQDRVPVRVLHAQHQVVPGHAGVVHQAVDPAVGLEDPSGRGGDRRAVGDVDRDGLGPAAGACDLLHGLRQTGAVPSREHDHGALGSERARDGPSDATRAPRHQDDLPVETPSPGAHALRASMRASSGRSSASIASLTPLVKNSAAIRMPCFTARALDLP